jgi:hypothetical protein
MQRFSCLVAIMLLVTGPVFAQSPPGTEAVTPGAVPLSAEKQLEIKTSFARYGRALRPGQELPRIQDKLAVGTTVPASVNLIALPQDAVTETPTTTTYRFVLMDTGIAVVDPETRKVVQIIE